MKPVKGERGARIKFLGVLKCVCMGVVEFVSSNFGPIFIALIVVALALPNAFDFLLPYLSLFLMAIMFFVFLKVNPREIVEKAKRPLLLAYILLLMAVVLPLAVFVAVQGLAVDLALGFFLVAAIVPGSSVLAWVSIFKGDLDLGLVLDVLYYLLFPFFFPLFVFYLFGARIEFDVVAMFVSLATLILVPLLLSQLLLFARRSLALRLSEKSNFAAIFF